VIKKLIKGLYNILGWPYHAVIKGIKAVWMTIKLGLKGLKKFVMNLPKIAKFIGKWIIDAIKESIAQIFTILGFFIAWFTLTGSAQDIVGIAIIASIVIWLLTIYIRD
tara:strand:+ start:1849 stop:2172 length:324 start_codon:yes stop_codon:yes gene_type:complete